MPKRTKYKTVEEVWNALDSGVKVYWKNEGYQVLVEPPPTSTPPEDNEYARFSLRDGMVLRVTYIENWFGSLLKEDELQDLFSIKEAK